MLSLAIDTATPTLVIGVARHDSVECAPGAVEVLAEVQLEDCRKHNEELIPQVHKVLANAGVEFADIDQIVVGCGPGPFTGLRVGMASAQALAHALRIPLKGVCTLDAIAGATGASLVATDARRREIYWARYRDGQRVEGPEVSAPDTVSGEETLISVPDALSEKLAATGPRTNANPSTAFLVCAPEIAVQPLYLRRPDAKLPGSA
ncbi:tRNA (adenosine(37)-N6)-threonylcarbamoyltransferase complex dimerization subunit type 1 TsaB [Corynebacterium aquilae]|uniref:Gcp-like domain-containing protein n=1 Tax=Corynebacterium aquilae DSM 44791 TaxID=1431546 RepID=A0A1L7CE43_9CORY|nr:tRNA (adenosine(37)-N6)-threonylcarbamoyltransferase complex dimerization subunit type 1 TsaB [Corynebacterium aquilae]APT84084.1 hypothetical protein CAQU_02240 [Corynebacterium aquilae DSM 44791]